MTSFMQFLVQHWQNRSGSGSGSSGRWTSTIQSNPSCPPAHMDANESIYLGENQVRSADVPPAVVAGGSADVEANASSLRPKVRT